MRLIQHSAINIQHFSTGQLQVEEGLYSYGARFYDSALGRFVSADTLIPQPGSPLAWDRYAYANGNPVRFNDPSGHMAECGNYQGQCGSSSKSNVVYWNHSSQSELAIFQEDQKATNHCAIYSIAAAYRLLNQGKIPGKSLAKYIDAHWNLKYRMFPNSATLPVQQVNVINDNIVVSVSPENDYRVRAEISSSLKKEIIENLKDSNSIQLVTFIWAFTPPPNVSYGDSNTQYVMNNTLIGGHTMVLVAFDPNHTGSNGILQPWGFVNSWIEGGNYLFWLSDADMERYTVVKVSK